MPKLDTLLRVDRHSIWHPYSAMISDLPVYPICSAEGVRLKMADGRELIDGMASWWTAIHGYNHPAINQALKHQIDAMSHIMFGGLTHRPAMELSTLLLTLLPKGLDAIFYCDSGSVAVEVAIKMAIQYWYANGEEQRNQFVSLRSAYHGDTLAAMSVCDPVTGMHTLFKSILPKNFFVEQPRCRFGEPCHANDRAIASLEHILSTQKERIAAVIMEPIMQGAGGMWFYSSEYLKKAHALCQQHDVLLILDEIATGFGRSGRMFACQHAGISPDIMCIGKALTGGYLSLAATISTSKIHSAIDNGKPGVFMHGPTFMANPLACVAALSSLQILINSPWQANIRRIERQLKQDLAPCKRLPGVRDVRVLGAVGVVEMKTPVDVRKIVPRFVDAGVWIRPFNKLIYITPAYIIDQDELHHLSNAIVRIVGDL